MKKFLLNLLLAFSLLSTFPMVQARRGGGSSFAGGLAGGMIGGVISGAMTKDSGSSRRAERKAERAEERTERVERERERERVEGLRQELYRQKGGFAMNILIFTVILLFLAIIGLAVMILKKKNNKG